VNELESDGVEETTLAGGATVAAIDRGTKVCGAACGLAAGVADRNAAVGKESTGGTLVVLCPLPLPLAPDETNVTLKLEGGGVAASLNVDVVVFRLPLRLAMSI
jgi:hypothetical protein